MYTLQEILRTYNLAKLLDTELTKETNEIVYNTLHVIGNSEKKIVEENVHKSIYYYEDKPRFIHEYVTDDSPFHQFYTSIDAFIEDGEKLIDFRDFKKLFKILLFDSEKIPNLTEQDTLLVLIVTTYTLNYLTDNPSEQINI